MAVERVIPIQPPPAVLVVDDHPMMRELTRRSFESHGCEVTVAEDGIEALRASNSRRFDLVLSDISMPHLDGIELATRLRNLMMSPRVVLMSADPFADPGMMGVDFVVKPLRPDDLRDLVDQVARDRMALVSGSVHSVVPTK